MRTIFPNVPTVLGDRIPSDFRLMVWKWSYPEERIGENVDIEGESFKKMLTIDLNIPPRGFAKIVNAHEPGSMEARSSFSRNYDCVSACPGCFNQAHLKNRMLELEDVIGVLDQAKELGCESAKFLGPGELVANPELFRILDEFKSRDIVLGIFTKGLVTGSDYLAQNIHGMSADALVARLVEYPNLTFLVGAGSFDPDFEQLAVPGRTKEIRTNVNNLEARNRTIELLCQAGMNADFQKQRMSLQVNPVTPENIVTAFDIFKWGTERNIPVYLPPTMYSGKGHKLERSARDVKFERDYVDLAVRVYSWLIERGITTFDEIREQGVHPYIGIAPCNQLTHGLYVHYDGAVWRCPGNDSPDFVVHSNIRDTPLRYIWRDSRNYRINKFNNRCVKDGFTLARSFYSDVAQRLGL